MTSILFVVALPLNRSSNKGNLGRWMTVIADLCILKFVALLIWEKFISIGRRYVLQPSSLERSSVWDLASANTDSGTLGVLCEASPVHELTCTEWRKLLTCQIAVVQCGVEGD